MLSAQATVVRRRTMQRLANVAVLGCGVPVPVAQRRTHPNCGKQHKGVDPMRALATLCVLCALGGGITAIVVTSPAGAAEQAPARARITPDAGLIAKIDHYRRLTWRWQTTMGSTADAVGQDGPRLDRPGLPALGAPALEAALEPRAAAGRALAGREDERVPARGRALAARDGRAVAARPAAPVLVGRNASEPQAGDARVAPQGCADEPPGGESAPPSVLALHPPLRGLLDRRGRAVLRRPPDGPVVPAALRRLPPSHEGDGRQTGRRRSRSGSRRRPTGAAAASTRGRTPPASAA